MPFFWTLDDVKVIGKRVLLRLDMNVPFSNGEILDETRLLRCIPTINELLLQNASIVIMSHRGRPGGKYDKNNSLEPVASRLSEILKREITFLHNCVGEEIEQHVQQMQPKDIVVLENLRFHPGEELNDPIFSKQLAHLGDVFVNDAFSVSHRAHASIVGVAAYMQTAAGRLMEEEINALTQSLENPVSPVVAIVGGAKVSTKITVLENLVQKVDALVLGGGIANTFLFAQGQYIGASLAEKSLVRECSLILETAKVHGCEIILPVDASVAKNPKDVLSRSVKIIEDVSSHDMILDLGPKSWERTAALLDVAKTVVWKGPVGLFEVSPYDATSMAIAKVLGDRTVKGELLSIAGGGETLAVLKKSGQLQRISFASTAGGAFLEWLEGRKLPGVAVLYPEGNKKTCG